MSTLFTSGEAVEETVPSVGGPQHPPFAPGLNNSGWKPLWFISFAPGPEPEAERQISSQTQCKGPACDRFSCVASAEWCSNFCCPGCAAGTGHTADCDKWFPSMLARVVPGFTPIPNDDFVRLLLDGRLPYRESALKGWGAANAKYAANSNAPEVNYGA